MALLLCPRQNPTSPQSVAASDVLVPLGFGRNHRLRDASYGSCGDSCPVTILVLWRVGEDLRPDMSVWWVRAAVDV